MVAPIPISLESRLSLRPFKKSKPRTRSIKSSRYSTLQLPQLPNTCWTQSMALTNGASTGANITYQMLSHNEQTANSALPSAWPQPDPPAIRDIPKPRRREHVVKLSSLEHCMPRAYIRICLAYKVPTAEIESQALINLNVFVRRLVDAKPYLAGWVVPAQDPGPQEGKMEVLFTLDDLNNFPTLQTRRFTHEEVPFDYFQLDKAGLPPSVIKPELVSALSESADENRAPVFRVQANLVDGGLIVSFYLHHCISDGTGMGLLISGAILDDDFTFKRNIPSDRYMPPELSSRLSEFANRMSYVRSALSWSYPNSVSGRRIRHRSTTQLQSKAPSSNSPGRGCIFSFLDETLHKVKEALTMALRTVDTKLSLTKTDVIQTLLWHHMTLARIPSLRAEHSVTHSRLLTPVNLRNKMNDPVIDDNYFGAAVDFAEAELSLEHLQKRDDASLVTTALAIHDAISKVDADYVRAAIALSNSPDPTVDVRDLQASNMNRTTGADMYITSWERMKLYSAELDLGLGKPDWVRKPWSRDPGSCIILPRNPKKAVLEVLVQMTEADMARLLKDSIFMAMVSRVVE